MSEQKAKRLSRIVDAKIVVDVEHHWLSNSASTDERRSALIRQKANEALEFISVLKDIKPRIEYEMEYPCSACGYAFEIDPETGLTACCGREVEPQS